VGAGPEQAALEGEASDEMQRVLNVLPTKYRVVLLLRYWYDFSYEEIATALQLTPALVKARLHRARELVARTMKAQGLEMPSASEEKNEAESTQQPPHPRKRRQAMAR
jgi:DNA-directed RNA polymerase specialized sigma24 family protein